MRLAGKLNIILFWFAVGAYSLLGLFSMYMVVSDNFWLKNVLPLTAGLEPIAKLGKSVGTGTRKTVQDSLWLEIHEGALIFDRDLLSTVDGARLEIEMSNHLIFFIEPESIVRLRKVDGQALLKITQGAVNVRSTAEQRLKIQRGATIEDVVIHAGTYLVKSDSTFGIQITAFNKKEKTKAAATGEAAEVAEAEDPKEQNVADQKPAKDDDYTPPPESKAPRTVFDLPTPKEATVFLLHGPNQIVVAARRICPDLCKLDVFKDRTLWRTLQFRSGEASVMRLPSMGLEGGRYDWVFSTETAEFRSFFQIKPFSDEALGKALTEGTPIEVL